MGTWKKPLGYRFSRPPFPRGWYWAAASADLGPRGVLAVRRFQRDLVVYRGDDGVARVLDAHCPHLGAHLGHGGCVDGASIRCPFHGWAFGGDGHCTDIPYAKKIPPNATVGAWPAREVNGHVMIWFDPAGGTPAWEVPDLPECASSAWLAQPTRSWTIRTHVQDMAENAVDAAHFKYVHGLDPQPAMTARADAHVLQVDSHIHYNESLGGAQGTLTTINWGMGFNITRFAGIVETLLVVLSAPVDPDVVVVRLNPYVKDLGDPEMTATVGGVFVQEIERQVNSDIPIWENKIMTERPVLCDGDGPIGTFRRWTAQFYEAAPSSHERARVVESASRAQEG